uniref:Secreted protein n=1 Tax=Steinernema glaseri TaxID=37863 RepID=A0A1I8AW93_9BILA
MEPHNTAQRSWLNWLIVTVLWLVFQFAYGTAASIGSTDLTPQDPDKAVAHHNSGAQYGRQEQKSRLDDTHLIRLAFGGSEAHFRRRVLVARMSSPPLKVAVPTRRSSMAVSGTRQGHSLVSGRFVSPLETPRARFRSLVGEFVRRRRSLGSRDLAVRPRSMPSARSEAAGNRLAPGFGRGENKASLCKIRSRHSVLRSTVCGRWRSPFVWKISSRPVQPHYDISSLLLHLVAVVVAARVTSLACGLFQKIPQSATQFAEDGRAVKKAKYCTLSPSRRWPRQRMCCKGKATKTAVDICVTPTTTTTARGLPLCCKKRLLANSDNAPMSHVAIRWQALACTVDRFLGVASAHVAV